MTSKELVSAVYPRHFVGTEYIGWNLYHTLYATRTGHHASIVIFSAKGKTIDEMWNNGKEFILAQMLKRLEA